MTTGYVVLIFEIGRDDMIDLPCNIKNFKIKLQFMLGDSGVSVAVFTIANGGKQS